jgi:hypothetical protein
MGNEHVNAPNTNLAFRGKVSEQHQNTIELVMQIYPVTL